jgi:hypothetical protein
MRIVAPVVPSEQARPRGEPEESHLERNRRTVPAARLGAIVVAAAAIAVAGCQRDGVQHFRVAKEAPQPAQAMPAAMPMGGGAGGPGMQGSVPPPSTAGGLTWTLPKGWTEARTGGMRYATITPPVKGKVDASVVVLPGPAGGELANVNRWRNQIGLPPLADEAAMAKARKTLPTPAGPLAVYDFSSDAQQSRVVAGLTVHEGATWFVKLSGDAAAVEAARPEFMKLLGSLRFDATNP